MADHPRHRIVDAMTIDIALPTIVYGDDPNPDGAHDALAMAQRQGPIGLGPYGPVRADADADEQLNRGDQSDVCRLWCLCHAIPATGVPPHGFRAGLPE
jgi:hypothetical protein